MCIRDRYKLAGILGALVAIIATIIPPFLIISAVSFFYVAFQQNIYVKTMLDGMQAGVGAVIAVVVYDMGKGIVVGRNWVSIFIMVAAFAANYVFKVNVIYVVLACGTIGVVRTLWEARRS